MILEREQIQRYLRHILMPEISGRGQKKLLDSSILIYCHSLSNSALMLYYLAAMGIGKISCYTEDLTGIKFIKEHINKLNPDVDFSIVLETKDNYDAAVICCEKSELPSNICDWHIPTILSATSGDYGFLKSIILNKSIHGAIEEINSFYTKISNQQADTLFNKSCISLLGVLTSIEVVKALLKIGITQEETLQFDLYSYDFEYGKDLANVQLYNLDQENIIKTINKAKVLIVGSGGLGSPVAYMLASMGIGKLGLVDYDTVEISNLNRQILHSTDKIEMAKVKSAAEFLKRLHPEMAICTYEQKFSIENAEDIIKDYDIVIDGLDNLPTRYLLNDVCYFMKKTLIEAGVLGFKGLATTIQPDIGPCYRCIFPESSDNSTIPACSETGVLGAVPGVMGIIQAIEALKHLTGIGIPLQGKILQFDAMDLDITVLDIHKEPRCELCGNTATIHSLKNYEFVCTNK